MRAFLQFDRQKAGGFVSALCSGLLVAGLALASPAFAAGGGGGGGGRRRRWRRQAGGDARGGGGGRGGDGRRRASHRMNQVGPHGLRPRAGLGHEAS